MWSPYFAFNTYLGFSYWKFNFQIILLSNLLGHEIFKRNSMKARMFILILFYSVSWLWCLGWNPEICLGTEEKHDYFLTILVRGTLFVVGVLGIQPRAVGVRQVLHSTACPPRTGPCSMGKFWMHREESWPVLDLHTREWFQSCREIESEAHLGQDPRTLLFSFSCPPCLPLPSSPLFPETRSLTGQELRESTSRQVLRLEVCATTLPGTCIPGKLGWSCY